MSMNENNVIDNSNNENLVKNINKNKKNRNTSNIKRLILVPKDDELNPSEPLYKYVEKVIVRVVDEYVRENKRPIRRKDLTEYVFAFDERTRKYDEVSKHDESIISYAITRLLKKKKLVKIQYCKEWKNGKCVEYYKRVDYILDEHLKDLELLQYLKSNGLVTETNE